MKKLPELNVKKGLYLTNLILAIIFFLAGLILEIINIVEADNAYCGWPDDWALFVTLVLNVVICLAFIFAIITVLVWNPENRGGVLLIAAEIYIVACGIAAAISGFALATCYQEVKYITPAIIAIIQIGMGAMGLVLRNHKPNASIVICTLAFCVIAINDLITGIGYITEAFIPAILSVYYFVVVAFDVFTVFVLLFMLGENMNKNPNDSFVSDEFNLEGEEEALGDKPTK